MKKVSTMAAQQSRNISQQKLTIGLDLRVADNWRNDRLQSTTGEVGRRRKASRDGVLRFSA